ncbi:MAG TPA: RidA family protein [Chloroflexota bacterium]|nr:RidA family protein [Chloroflexota bacterium]
MLGSLQASVARRRLLLGGAIGGFGALVAGTAGAQTPTPAAPSPDFEILQYDPPRRFAAGARVGNIIYLAGEDGKVWTSGDEWYMIPGGIIPQTERCYENIRASLRHFGSDLQYIFKQTTYYINYDDRNLNAEVRRRYLPRPVPGTAVQVASLSDPDSLIEVDVMAVIP